MPVGDSDFMLKVCVFSSVVAGETDNLWSNIFGSQIVNSFPPEVPHDA